MRSTLLAAVLLLAGCATGQPGSTNTVKEIIGLGVIESVTPIELDDSSSLGGSIGSIFGQAGGAGTGGGRGATVGSIFGSVLGGTLGQQSGIATKPGLEIWVKLDGDGKSFYVMQPGAPDAFKVGERVRVVRQGGETRVEAQPAAAP